MKMIIAINNRALEQRLSVYYELKYDVKIFHTKESIVSFIKENESYIIVVRSDLQGELSLLDFIEEIRNKCLNVRFIVLVKELTQQLKELLFSKEIFNIIEGKKFLFDDLIDNIENPQMIVYKTSNRKANNIIFVTGMYGSGKTVICHIIAKKMASHKENKILLFDMDYINPCIDIYLSGTKNYSLIDYIKDVMDSKIKDYKSYETIDKKYSNLKYILNSKNIGIPKELITCLLLNKLIDNYDFIVVDTSSLMINQIFKISKQLNGKLLYVLEPKKSCLRAFDNNPLKSDILKDSFIVLNKCRNKDKDYIKKYIPVEVYATFKYQSNIEKYIEKGRVEKVKCNINKLLKNLGLIRFEKWKNRLLEKILNLEEE